MTKPHIRKSRNDDVSLLLHDLIMVQDGPKRFRLFSFWCVVWSSYLRQHYCDSLSPCIEKAEFSPLLSYLNDQLFFAIYKEQYLQFSNCIFHSSDCTISFQRSNNGSQNLNFECLVIHYSSICQYLKLTWINFSTFCSFKHMTKIWQPHLVVHKFSELQLLLKWLELLCKIKIKF